MAGTNRQVVILGGAQHPVRAQHRVGQLEQRMPRAVNEA
jgi:hypothetical protein